MPGFLIAAVIAGASFLAGVLLGALVLRTVYTARGARRGDPDDAPPGVGAPEAATSSGPRAPPGAAYRVALIERSLRSSLRPLKRDDPACPTLPRLERLAEQARMLAQTPRPLQARPTSPVALLREAAEQVEALRLGKVGIAWTLLTRQPVLLDPERARPALRELLHASADSVGEGGRIAVRIRPGAAQAYPVRLEIEAGRAAAEPDAIAYAAAHGVLSGQGARIESDGPIVRIALPSVQNESAGPVDQTPSNR